MKSWFKTQFKEASDVSIEAAYQKWNSMGFLDELNFYDKIKVAAGYETASILLEIHEFFCVLNGDIYNIDEEDKFSKLQSLMYPVIRRVLTKCENINCHLYVVDIFNMAKKNILSNYGQEIMYGNNLNFKREFYNAKVVMHTKYKSFDDMMRKNNYNSVEDIKCDWEAEYTSYLSNEIVNYLDNKTEDEL